MSESAVVYKLPPSSSSSQAILAHPFRHSSASVDGEKKWFGVITFTLTSVDSAASVTVSAGAAGGPAVIAGPTNWFDLLAIVAFPVAFLSNV